MSSSANQHPDVSPNELPFVAPCCKLDATAPVQWLILGWKDFKRAPRQSMTYGAVMMLLSYLVSIFAFEFDGFYSILFLISAFLLLGPIIAIGLYSISCQLQEGNVPVLGYCLREGRRHIGNTGVFALMLMVVFLIWARAASMLHVFYPMTAHPSLSHYVVFLVFGTSVGALFSFIIFTASAFSLPMIMDRKVDTITAVITSVNAVLRNKKAMFVWAFFIFLSVVLSVLTAFIGLIVFLPVIGHATWHAYQQTIDARQWPRHE